MWSIYPRLGGPVYKVDQVPEHFQESYIVKGYRNPKSSAVQCLLSIFDATNETLNFWTHFLPCLYFLWVLKGLSEQLDFWNDSYTWPLLAYMLMCCAFPMASAIAHLFNTMSDKARHVCFFVDYAALSLFSFGVAIVHRSYVFPAELRQLISVNLFIFIAAVNTCVCTGVSCQSRFMPPSLGKKVMRVSAFAGPYLYDCVPIIYRLLFGSEEELQMESHYYHVRQFIFVAASAFLYITHIPERLQPGCFDIVGHSHQWFHVFSILGTLDHMRGSLMDMEHRREYITATGDLPSATMCLSLTALVVFLNIVVVLYYSMKLYANKSKTLTKDQTTSPISRYKKS